MYKHTPENAYQTQNARPLYIILYTIWFYMYIYLTGLQSFKHWSLKTNLGSKLESKSWLSFWHFDPWSLWNSMLTDWSGLTCTVSFSATKNPSHRHEQSPKSTHTNIRAKSKPLTPLTCIPSLARMSYFIFLQSFVTVPNSQSYLVLHTSHRVRTHVRHRWLFGCHHQWPQARWIHNFVVDGKCLY